MNQATTNQQAQTPTLRKFCIFGRVPDLGDDSRRRLLAMLHQTAAAEGERFELEGPSIVLLTPGRFPPNSRIDYLAAMIHGAIAMDATK